MIRVFQAEATAGAKALRLEWCGCILTKRKVVVTGTEQMRENIVWEKVGGVGRGHI